MQSIGSNTKAKNTKREITDEKTIYPQPGDLALPPPPYIYRSHMMATTIAIPENSNASNSYHYLPLPPVSKCIRLLHVHAPSSPGDDRDTIRCDLQVVDLASERCPPFAALTYVWGTKAAGTNFITCGASTLAIMQNCHSALEHLRKKLGEFTIWVDAICINQDDEGEKMMQIPLMGDIYSNAKTVYVWLGDADAATNRAMTYLETAGYMKYFFSKGELTEDELPKPRIWAATWASCAASISLTTNPFPSLNCSPNWLSRHLNRLPIIQNPAIECVSYDDLNVLLDREWIKRIWTYQEILLASNPVVVCGDCHLPWSRFALSITFLEYSGTNYPLDGNPIISTLNTWAEVALSRDHITSTASWGTNDIQTSTLPETYSTQLQKYQNFITSVSRKHTIFQRLVCAVTLVCAPALTSLCTFWIAERYYSGTRVVSSTVTSLVVGAATEALSSAVACAVACEVSGISACADACDAASSAASTAADLSLRLQQQVPYHTLDLIYGLIVAVIIFFMSFFNFIIFKLRKFCKLNPLLRGGDPKVDLVNGICTRKSEDKKDKAFGLHAILQRLSEIELPAPDNTLLLEQIYKQLSIHLIKLTGSLQLLLPAALHSFPGHPSWVPNWAAEFESFWLNPSLSGYQPKNTTPGSRCYWRWDPGNDNVLIVHGRQLCTIANCFKFRATWNAYDMSQRDLHLENLRTMLEFWDVFRDKTLPESISLPILNRTNDFGLFQCISRRQLTSWIKFLNLMRGEDPAKVLSHLKSKDSKPSFGSGRWFRAFTSDSSSTQEILCTQIAICNSLAKTGRIFFTTNILQTEFSLDYFPIIKTVSKTMGIGSCKARIGDTVVLIAGVRSPLIIRRSHSSTQLISPAIVNNAMEGQAWCPEWEREDLEEFALS